MSSGRRLISRSYKIRVGITAGDPSGIGPAITLKALSKLKGLADFTVIADAGVFSRLKTCGRIASGIRFIDLKNVDPACFSSGKITAEYGRASVEYLDKALELLKDKQIDCLVTCPLSKEAVSKSIAGFTGQTEYLAEKTGTEEFVMMLLNKKLKFALVTRHVPLKDVAVKLDKEKIYKTVSLTYLGLKKIFNLRRPRIVVCGLNPHASDNGLLGNEENSIIKPCLKILRKRLHGRIDGPMPADVAIGRAYRGDYDCCVAMFHDQALIPLKLSDADTGINLTMGLPFIRTSPLHGTAFDIARKPSLARPDSLIEAIKLAVQCTLSLKKD